MLNEYPKESVIKSEREREREREKEKKKERANKIIHNQRNFNKFVPKCKR